MAAFMGYRCIETSPEVGRYFARSDEKINPLTFGDVQLSVGVFDFEVILVPAPHNYHLFSIYYYRIFVELSVRTNVRQVAPTAALPWPPVGGHFRRRRKYRDHTYL